MKTKTTAKLPDLPAAKLPELAEGVALGVDALDEAEELSEEEAE
jgi:hypothetical protein